MNFQENFKPSLKLSFPLSSKQTSRVVTSAESPKPHRGWYSRGYLPHWDHPGMIQSINFRLGDSLPLSVLHKWKQELGLLPPYSKQSNNDSEALSQKTANQRDPEVQLRRRIEDYLDAGHGQCWLRQPEIARLVQDALLHFDGERYCLLAWCVMPNHVHVLIETKEGFPLAAVLHSWKSFVACQANKLIGRSGEFWQREYLDRYIRNAEHHEKIVAYMEENPVKAGLAKINTDWLWSSAGFRVPGSVGILPAS